MSASRGGKEKTLMAHDVFISYSHLDIETAEAICGKLESEGIKCWYAPRDIGPGEEWASAIMKALNACRVMILVFSDASNASVQVLREVNNAVSSRKTIIPFKTTENGPTGAMQYYLATLHWLDANGAPLEESLEELCSRVRAVLDGEADESEESLPGDTGTRRGKHRKKLSKGTIWLLLRMIGTAFLFIFTFTMVMSLSSYRNGTSVTFMLAAALFFTILVFQMLKLIPKWNRHILNLICVVLLVLLSVGFGIAGSNADSHSPGEWIPDRGAEASMNTPNYSFAVRSSDGQTVYYADNDGGDSPRIACCSYDDFANAGVETVLVRDIWADNLALVGDRYLVFRDFGTGKYIMKVYDLETAEIRTLKTKSSYGYIAGDTCVFYGEDTTAARGIGVITIDGKYDNTRLNISVNYRIMTYYKGKVYFLADNGMLTDSNNQTISTDVQDRFIICDDYVYYKGSTGSLMRAPLDDTRNIERVSYYAPFAMVIHDGWVYYLNNDDNNYLYRVPIEGGDDELILSHAFNALNIVGDYLYLCENALQYVVYPLSNLA